MASHGPALPSRRQAPSAYDLFPQASVSSWLDGLQAKIHAGLGGEPWAEPARPLSPLRASSPAGIGYGEGTHAAGDVISSDTVASLGSQVIGPLDAAPAPPFTRPPVDSGELPKPAHTYKQTQLAKVALQPRATA